MRRISRHTGESRLKRGKQAIREADARNTLDSGLRRNDASGLNRHIPKYFKKPADKMVIAISSQLQIMFLN
jgi:hypothetical protein